MVLGAPLEDARHLAQRYDRMRQEAEAQVPRKIIPWSNTIILHRNMGVFFFLELAFVITSMVEFYSCAPSNSKQATEVARRQAKARESQGNPDILMKLESAEAKLQDLKSNMTTLGKEAASALSSVQDQQQKLTLERLIAMVVWLNTCSIFRSTLIYLPICTSFDTNIFFISHLKVESERGYHQRVLQILDQLEGEVGVH